MACRRCGGLMVAEGILPSLEESSSSESQRTRCLNCGDVEDSVICLNRTGRMPGRGSIARLRDGIRL